MALPLGEMPQRREDQVPTPQRLRRRELSDPTRPPAESAWALLNRQALATVFHYINDLDYRAAPTSQEGYDGWTDNRFVFRAAIVGSLGNPSVVNLRFPAVA